MSHQEDAVAAIGAIYREGQREHRKSPMSRETAERIMAMTELAPRVSRGAISADVLAVLTAFFDDSRAVGAKHSFDPKEAADLCASSRLSPCHQETYPSSPAGCQRSLDRCLPSQQSGVTTAFGTLNEVRNAGLFARLLRLQASFGVLRWWRAGEPKPMLPTAQDAGGAA